MSAKKPKVYWRRGHCYVHIQIEITEEQWDWLHDVDRDSQIGISGHIRFALSQYRARARQHDRELTKCLQKQAGSERRKLRVAQFDATDERRLDQ